MNQVSFWGLSVRSSGAIALTTALTTLSVGFLSGERPAFARPVPDNTLGAESSVVVPVSDLRDRIEGGAVRGANLFHSFEVFDIPEGREAYFGNPAGITTILGRVTGSDVSDIFGTLGVEGSANLFLLNPNGIVFGPNAQLDIGGSFVASTAERFMFPDGSGFSAVDSQAPPLLTINGPIGLQTGGRSPAPLVNAGNLAVEQQQGLTLAGGTVVSTGELMAPGGHVNVAAIPENSDVQLGERGEVLSWSAVPTGSADEMATNLRVNELTVSTAELLDAVGIEQAALPTDIPVGTTLISGRVDASDVDVSDVDGIGGRIQVLGDRVQILNAQVDASGLLGGGTVLIGGNYRGQGPLPNARQTDVTADSLISADAFSTGNGGRIVVWADDTATVHGILTARGGTASGNGGLIETSGQQFLTITTTPDASAPNGNGGTWLIDPTNITIVNGGGGAIGSNTVDAANISAALNSGTNVTISTSIGGTDEGNITQNNDAPIRKTAGGNATLFLQANNDISLNTDITSSSGQLNIDLLADSDNNGVGEIVVSNADILTNNGDLTGASRGVLRVSNSNIKSQQGNIGLLVAERIGTQNEIGALEINTNSILESTTGDITLTGTGSSGVEALHGLLVNNSTIRTRDGNINLTGTGGSNATNTNGIVFSGGSILESTGTGAITLIGIGGSGGDAQGIAIGFANAKISSSDGNISLTGTANGNGNTFLGDQGILIFNDGVIESTGNGNITLNGIGGNANTGGNTGILIGGEVSSIGTGNIVVNGLGGSNGNTNNLGILISTGRVSAINSNITLTGTGNGTGKNNTGIVIDIGGVIESRNSGTINLEGISGIGTMDNHGILIDGVGSEITAEDGNISLIGVASENSDDINHGVHILKGGLVQSSGSGTINVTGLTNANSANEFGNDGISIIDRGGIESLGTGDITLVGTSGNGTISNQGIVILDPGSRVSSIDGNIFLRGISRGAGSGHYGIWLGRANDGAVQTTGIGNITLEGVINGIDNASEGIFFGDGGTVEATGNGDIKLTSDEISIVGNQVRVAGRNRLQLQPFSPTLDISVGSDIDDNRLNLNTDKLDLLQNGFSQVIIGRDDGSGAVEVLPVDFTSPTIIQSPALGGSITTTGPITTANTPLMLTAGGGVVVDSDIDTGGSSLNIVGSQITQNDGSSIFSQDASFTSSSGPVILNTITAETLTVDSAGAILGNGILTIASDATFTSNLANAGTVSITNAEPTTIGYSIIGGDLTLNSATPVSQALGEPLQVAGTILLNGTDAGAEDDPLVNTPSLDFGDDPPPEPRSNGDVVITKVGLVDLEAQSVSGNLVVNSLPIGVVEFTDVFQSPAITLNNPNNSFGGTIRVRTNLGGANIAEATPGITQNGTQIVNSTAILNANGGDIVLNDAANQFGSIEFSGHNVTLAEQNATRLEQSAASGNFMLTSGGLIDQTGRLSIAGDAMMTTRLSQAGTVTLTNTNATVLGNSLIGGDFIINSGGSISQAPQTVLQVAGDTNIDLDALNFTVDSEDVLGRINFSNGDVVITRVGPISLDNETVSENLTVSGTLTVTSLAERLQFINNEDGSNRTYAPVAINLNANNSFGGTVSLTTDAPTTVVESGTPSITQTSVAVDVAGTADFTAEGGSITLTDENNAFGNLAFNSDRVFIHEENSTNVLESTATESLTLRSGGAITQSGPITSGGSLELSADDTITQTSQILAVGPLTLNAIGDISTQNLNSLGGFIDITSTQGDINTTGGAISSSLSTGAGGDVTLTARRGDLRLGNINAEGFIGGLITLTAGDTLHLEGDNVDSNTTGEGTGQGIRVSADTINILNGGRIRSQTEGPGDAGPIIINARQLFIQNSIPASTQFTGIGTDTRVGTIGTGGDISIDVTEQLQVVGNDPTPFEPDPASPSSVLAAGQIPTGITTATLGSGDAGNLKIEAGNIVVEDQAGITTAALSMADNAGSGGRLDIRADSIALSNRAGFATATIGPGHAGNLSVDVDQDLTLQGGATIAADTVITASGDAGNAGNIRISARNVNVQSGARIGSSTASSGEGGDIFVHADRINVRGMSLVNAETSVDQNEIDGTHVPSTIASSALAGSSGPAGNLTIDTQTLNVTNEGEIAASTAGTESAGNIRIQSDRISLNNNSRITSSTSGIGNAGTIRIREATRINLDTNSEISTAVEQGARGEGGDIRVEGDRLSLNNNAAITSSTSGVGDAGTINITDATRIRLDTGSEISTEVESGAEGTAGDIWVEGDRLSLGDNASITSSTSGMGDAGTIRIIDANAIELDTQSSISTAARPSATGDGGTIRLLNIGNLDLQSRATISARGRANNNAGNIDIEAETVSLNQSRIIAATDSGEGGDISLRNLATLEVLENSSVSATTSTGKAGDLSIVASESVLVTEQSELSVAAISQETPESSAASTSRTPQRANEGDGRIAGNLSIETNSLEVSDDSRISVESLQGQAGNIDITASTIMLNDGDIEATTGRNPSDGTRSANVNLTLTGLDDSLRLQNGSLILADASLDSGAEFDANAGNITINAPNGFIIADVFENSDIIATAGEGDGGNINLTAFDVFGIEERSGSRSELRNNNTNDISASSQFGTSGNVAVNDLGIDPVQAAADLPTETAQPALSQGCQPGNGRGSFTNTEQGGIPPSPDDPIASEDAWEDIHPPESPTDAVAITEAGEWSINEDGQLVLHPASIPDSFQLTCQSQ